MQRYIPTRAALGPYPGKIRFYPTTGLHQFTPRNAARTLCVTVFVWHRPNHVLLRAHQKVALLVHLDVFMRMLRNEMDQRSSRIELRMVETKRATTDRPKVKGNRVNLSSPQGEILGRLPSHNLVPTSIMESLAKELAALGIPSTHVDIGLTNLVAGNRSFRSILVNRRLPDEGWSDTELQRLLYTLSSLDTNQPRWCGVGEREGRVYSSLVATRHFGLAHGTGRSGDLTEAQPKAVGSTILVKLTRLLLLDAVRRGSGLTQSVVGDAIVLPLCTGMSMALVLTTLRQQAPDKSVVLWSRIDQKSCFKAIAAAGLECVVIETKMEGDEVVTDLDAMRAALVEHGPNVLAVLSTTSCFAPRVGDRIDEIAKLCEEFSTSHVVNNAYGLQCAATSKLLKRAVAVGTLTAVVCSTDKNFMVPVGK